MYDVVTQRVNDFREREGLSIRAFALKLGMLQETLNKQLKDDGRGASLSTIVLILDTYPDLSAEWLLRGKGSMQRKDDAQADTVADLRSHIKTLMEMNELLKEKIERLETQKKYDAGGNELPMAAKEITYKK